MFGCAWALMLVLLSAVRVDFVISVPRAVVVLFIDYGARGADNRAAASATTDASIERLLRTAFHVHGSQALLEVADGAHRTDALVTATDKIVVIF